MEKTYAHWRAAHPLVFISGHLCIGVLLAEIFSPIISTTPQLVAILILFSTLILLGLLFQFCSSQPTINFIITGSLVSWGVAIFLQQGIRICFTSRSHLALSIIAES